MVPPIIPPTIVKRVRWQKFVFCLPLLGVPPIAMVLFPYLEGRGYVPRELDLIGLAAILLLPLVLSVFLAVQTTAAVWKRIAFFIITVILQYTSVFTLVPAPAESEMIGLTQRLDREFSADEIRTCSAQLRQKEQNGTLVLKEVPKEERLSPWPKSEARIIEDAELPANLRGKFQHILIVKHQTSDEQEVETVFQLEQDRGILCSTHHYKNDFWRHQMADGIYAYRYMRP